MMHLLPQLFPHPFPYTVYPNDILESENSMFLPLAVSIFPLIRGKRIRFSCNLLTRLRCSGKAELLPSLPSPKRLTEVFYCLVDWGPVHQAKVANSLAAVQQQQYGLRVQKYNKGFSQDLSQVNLLIYTNSQLYDMLNNPEITLSEKAPNTQKPQ